MYKIVLNLVVFFLLAVSCQNAQLASIYVSPSGNDANPGTKEKPLATLQAARDRAREFRQKSPESGSVKIIMQEGVYRMDRPLVFGPEDAAPDNSFVLIKGEGDVIIQGGKELPPFEKVNDALWKITLPGEVYPDGKIQQLYVNGERAVRARVPNSGFFVNAEGSVTERIDSSGAAPIAIQTMKLTEEQFAALPENSSEPIILSVNHAWDQTRKYIRGISKKDRTITVDGRKMQPWNTLDNSSQFIFENSRAFLDMPGEWFLDDSNTLYYIPRENEKIESTVAIVPILESLIFVKGTKEAPVTNISFDNISFLYSRYAMPDTGDEPEQAGVTKDAVVMLDFARNISFNNCEFAKTGNNAIWFRRACIDCAVTRSYLHDLGIGGVKIGEWRIPESEDLLTKNITVDNNIIRAGGRVIPTGIGVIIFHASDNNISHNEIADFKYSGVSTGWVWGYGYSPSKRNNIVYNHIHHLGWGELSDMGGIYSLGKSEGSVLGNNLIHDIYSFGYGGWGLYTDEGSTGMTLENNLVYNCKSSGFHQHYGQDNVIRNNIFAYNLISQLQATRIEDHNSFFFTNNILYFRGDTIFEKPGGAGWRNWEKVQAVEDNNCFWSTTTENPLFGDKHIDEWRTVTGKDMNSIIADPGFVDPENYDFRFKDQSVIQKIGFVPFDYSEAGVYGDKEWVELANSENYSTFDAQCKR